MPRNHLPPEPGSSDSKLVQHTNNGKVHRGASSGVKTWVKRPRMGKSLRVSPGKLVRAQAMLVQGHSNREVSPTLHMSTHTVARVIRSEEFQSFLKEMQERLFAIAPDAMDSFHATVRVDGHLAYIFMKDLGIVPSPESRSRLLNPAPEMTPEARAERQVRGLARLMLDRRRIFGIELPPDMQRFLDADEAAHPSEGKETEKTKLLRR